MASPRDTRRMRFFSLEGKLAAALVAWSVLTAAVMVVAWYGLGSMAWAVVAAVFVLLLPALLLARMLAKPVALQVHPEQAEVTELASQLPGRQRA